MKLKHKSNVDIVCGKVIKKNKNNNIFQTIKKLKLNQKNKFQEKKVKRQNNECFQ